MMEPPAGVEGVLLIAAQDRLDGTDRTAGDHRARLVHPFEARVVATPSDACLARPERVFREPPHSIDVGLVVAPAKFLVRGRLGRKARRRPDRSQ